MINVTLDGVARTLRPTLMLAHMACRCCCPVCRQAAGARFCERMQAAACALAEHTGMHRLCIPEILFVTWRQQTFVKGRPRQLPQRFGAIWCTACFHAFLGQGERQELISTD